jgi:hypothetical protein
LNRFIGNFGDLQGGMITDAALLFSGGIHDIYWVERVIDDEKRMLNDPTSNELFEIIKQALKLNNTVGMGSFSVISFILKFN